jgi:hypothetical protein
LRGARGFCGNDVGYGRGCAKGLDVFLLAAMPGATSYVVHDIADIPRWWISLPLMPLALLRIAQEERAAAEHRSGG